MYLSNKAQLFSLDIMLALVPLTIALGISANAMSGVVNQMQEYSDAYHMRRMAIDAADVIVKTAGTPEDWESNNSPSIVGLAVFDTASNRTEPNKLDINKIENMSGAYLADLLAGEFSYYNLSIYPINASADVSWFENVSWSGGSRADKKDIVVVERFAYLENGTNTTFVGVRLEVGR